jgi:hypothetical protein
MSKRVKYFPTPEKCNICKAVFKKEEDFQFVDGKTQMGPWANMCMECHTIHGVGIGTGYGQVYEYDVKEDAFFKVAG